MQKIDMIRMFSYGIHDTNHRFDIGNIVTIINNYSDHIFKIGDTVKIESVSHFKLPVIFTAYTCINKDGISSTVLDRELSEIEYLHEELDINYEAKN